MNMLIIGGGWFGLYIANYFGNKGVHVDVYERDSELMMRASYHNQARVHNGYHYPRSVLTAMRSRISFPRFVNDFSDCICNDFDKYYMIGKHLSKVTSYQFNKFCKRIGAYIEPAPSEIVALTDKNYIEAVFSTKEFAFDSVKLRQAILSRINENFVNIHLDTEVDKIIKNEQSGKLQVYLNSKKNGESIVEADHVFNCTYANLNHVISNSGLEIIPLKHEMTEMVLVEVPEIMKKMGITVMCGPFFSVMPFPSVTKNGGYLHSFSHVRYTPHYEWYEEQGKFSAPYSRFSKDKKNTAWNVMVKDAARYIPILSECKYHNSLWEVKTVLPRSESDDSRPILCKFNYGIKGFHSVMGGKIDNAYDAVSAIEKELGL